MPFLVAVLQGYLISDRQARSISKSGSWCFWVACGDGVFTYSTDWTAEMTLIPYVAEDSDFDSATAGGSCW